jgi:hypothetical protein
MIALLPLLSSLAQAQHRAPLDRAVAGVAVGAAAATGGVVGALGGVVAGGVGSAGCLLLDTDGPCFGAALGAGIGGGATAGAGGGAALAALAVDADPVRAAAFTLAPAVAGTVLFSAGLGLEDDALRLTGAALVAAAPVAGAIGAASGPGRARGRGVQITPVAGPGGGHVVIAGRF